MKRAGKGALVTGADSGITLDAMSVPVVHCAVNGIIAERFEHGPSATR
jgi:hypothetical protein